MNNEPKNQNTPHGHPQQSNRQSQFNGPMPQPIIVQPYPFTPDRNKDNKNVSNGLGIASLILGVLGTLTLYIFGIYIPAIGIILGVIQLKHYANNSDKNQDGRHIALAGVSVSIFTTLLSLIYIIINFSTFLDFWTRQ